MSINHSKNIIEVRDVSFAYNGETVLENINLDVHQGDYLGIVGPNGGGKTTLVKLILGLLKPKTGSIKLNVPFVGYVPQNATSFDNNFPITVKEVVAQGRLNRSKLFRRLNSNDWKMVDQALKTVDMLDYRDRLIGSLSGGQQQRIFIARAIVGNHPHVIFLDEPTTGIDLQSQKRFYSFLKNLNQNLNITLILISHEIEEIAEETNHVSFINHSLTYYSNPKDIIKEHFSFEHKKHV